MIKYPKTVLDLLDNASEQWADKVCYESENESITFSAVRDLALRIGTAVAKECEPKTPVIVWSTKTIYTPSLLMGALYGGCFYAPIGDDTPFERVKIILENVKPSCIIVDGIDESLLKSIACKVIKIADCKTIDEKLIQIRRANIVDTEPQTLIFTSGSTGVPKGVVLSHMAITDLIDVHIETFGITENTIIGNQAPIFYVSSLRDIVTPIVIGCRCVIIPKSLFLFPTKLVQLIEEKKISLLDWASSAFSMLYSINAFENTTLQSVKNIIFRGSTLSCNVLKYVFDHFPNAVCENVYGCTEAPSPFTRYTIKRNKDYSKGIPLGSAVKNRHIFLLSGENKPTPKCDIGEICLQGASLAMGYFNDETKTKNAFIQNPLNKSYPEIIFRTGDFGAFDENGELMFHGRTDNCIKHMGHRIELGDIENAALKCDKVKECVCIYDKDKGIICLFYTGDVMIKELLIELRDKLPSYMIPRKIIVQSDFPRMFNGKIDVQQLKRMVK